MLARPNLDDVFFALSGETRRQILARLGRGPATIQEIADPFDVSLNTVSKHVRILERAGLITRQIRGREHHCRLRGEPLAAAAGFLRRYETFWSRRLDAMEEVVKKRASRVRE